MQRFWHHDRIVLAIAVLGLSISLALAVFAIGWLHGPP